MKRVTCQARPDWKEQAHEMGYTFYETEHGTDCWDETCYYEFSLAEIENNLEAATNELHEMCLEIVEAAIADEEYLRRLAIPEFAWEAIRVSYLIRQPSLYGRFDLCYDGKGPPKMLEYNADTPTSLFESGVFQWYWMEQMREDGVLPSFADQFNSIHDRLVDRFKALRVQHDMLRIHFTCMEEFPEDRGTVGYLEDCARQAGVDSMFVPISSVAHSEYFGQFIDQYSLPIYNLFKLYPWEWILRDEFGPKALNSKTHFIEPAWKMILSNKGVLPLLWERYEGHPNLLPAYFANDVRRTELGNSFAKKPLLSREGANVLLVKDRQVIGKDDGPYGSEGYIFQGLADIPKFDDNYVVIGSWVVHNDSAGIIVRESKSALTDNWSRLVPHVIIG